MKHQGFVLITVIFLLNMLSIFVIAELRWIIADSKRVQAFQQFQEKMQGLDRITERLAEQFIYKIHADCLIKEVIQDEQMKQNITKNTCVVQEHYHYGISDLGIYPCVRLTKKVGVHHWLLSVMDTDLPNHMVQLRITTPEESAICDKKPIIYIPLGILTRSWL